jgi:hypothetical protein
LRLRLGFAARVLGDHFWGAVGRVPLASSANPAGNAPDDPPFWPLAPALVVSGLGPGFAPSAVVPAARC